MVELTADPIIADNVIDKVRGDGYGAIVTFLGTVRGYSEAGRTLSLEYEAHRDMALQKLQEIVNEIKARWGLEDVAICHRLGKLVVGETCLVIAVAAPHRKEAFEACEYAIEAIKQVVPIWKKETTTDKSYWVGSKGRGH